MHDIVRDLQSERLPVHPKHGDDITELGKSLDRMLNENESLRLKYAKISYIIESDLFHFNNIQNCQFLPCHRSLLRFCSSRFIWA